MKKKFVPVTGLDNLNEEQKQEYYRDACEYFKIPAELNLLEFIWLDSGDNSGRHLVLYAKKGATDIMRSNHAIHVDEMEETIGDGFIMFTAKGHDSTGRTDVSVGAADTKGLSGRAITNAIMTAQTRATRRLTLQFVGGGLLDESEVQAGVTTTIETVQGRPLGNVAPPPVVAPSAAPGRDITKPEEPKQIDNWPMGETRTFTVGSSLSPEIEKCLDDTAEKARNPESVPASAAEETPKKRRRRRSSEVVLDAPKDELLPHPATVPLKSTVDTLDPTPAQLEARKALELSLPKLKQDLPVLKKDSEVIKAAAADLEDDEIKQLEALLAKARDKKAQAVEPTPAPIQLTPAPPAIAPAVAPVEEKSEPPVAIVGLPKPTELEAFKIRLFAYTNDVLRKGNMKGTEGIGGVEYKVRAFIKVFFPNTKDVKHLTVDQWTLFLGYLDEKYAELGAEGLVKLINSMLGVKE